MKYPPPLIYLDDLGLPVTKEGDGGDSAAEAGTLLTLDHNVTFLDVGLYLPSYGPVRHPDPSKWYGRRDRFSRDQLIALLCGLVMRPGYADEKEDLYLMHKRRYFLTAWNKIRNFQYEDSAEQMQKAPQVKWDPRSKTPDFTGPEVWALWLRMWPRWWKWPLCCILDLETLVSAVVWRFKSGKIARNHLLAVYVSMKVLPTPVSWLARVITPIGDLIDRWGEHCRETGAIDTSVLFRRAFRR